MYLYIHFLIGNLYNVKKKYNMDSCHNKASISMKTDIYSLLTLKICCYQPPKAKLSTYINTRLLNTVLIHISV